MSLAPCDVIGIDPGTTESAFVCLSVGSPEPKISAFGLIANADLERELACAAVHDPSVVACEMIASYGMAVGFTTFETCVWIGRFDSALRRQGVLNQKVGDNKYLAHITPVFRKKTGGVLMHLCKNNNAKDGNVRQALIDRYGAPGTKKSPGATYGISNDVWQALGVATYAYDLILDKSDKNLKICANPTVS